MKTLFEIAKCNVGSTALIENFIITDNKSPIWKLYKIVFSENYMTEKQVMLAIYGKINLTTFFRLKNRLMNILINVSIMSIATKEPEHSRSNEIINQFRYTLAAKIFIQLNKSYIAVSLAEKIITKSIKFHSTENVLLLIRILILHYGSVEYNRIKLSKYFDIQNKFLDLQFYETKAENYYFDLQQTHFKSLAIPDQEIIDKAKKYVEELDKITNVQSYLFYFNRYRVKATYYEFIKDFPGLLRLTNTTIKLLNTPDFYSIFSQNSMILRKTYALIQIDKKDEAIVLSCKEMDRLPLGSFPWFFLAHYRLKAYLYKGDYKNSIELIQQIIENPQFQKLGSNLRELFTAALGYIHLIVDSGIAGDPKKLKPKLPDFKIGKFLNTVPVFSKDKKGINVSILLMHIAFLLQKKNYNAIIDRIDSLKQYAYKYLRKDDTFRSNCMIKLVIQMTKADFNPIRTERYTKDLINQLEQVKLAGSGENIETEIIPYEVLWTIMKRAVM